MKIEKIAALGEIVSSVAIVATLAYLGVQTQQTNAALFASSRAQIMSADIALIVESANSPYSEYLHDVVPGLLRPGVELTEAQVVDTWRTYNLLAGFTLVREFAWFQYRDGFLEEGAWNGYMATLVRNLSNDTGRSIWEVLRPELDPEFVAYVDARLASN